MNSLYEFITNPATLVEFIVFVFSLWAMWSKLNWRISALEKKTEEIDVSKIETKLAEISTDLQWVKMELQKLSK